MLVSICILVVSRKDSDISSVLLDWRGCSYVLNNMSYLLSENIFQFVISDADEELLFNIPFTGNIKLKGVIVVGGEDESHPAKMRL